MKLDIERLRKEGKLKTLDDAFKEYPSEDYLEDFYVCEKPVSKSKYVVGDIVYVRKYKYEDGKEDMNHLFVVIDAPNMLMPLEYACILISSQVQKLKYKTNMFIPKSYTNGLLKNSIVKTDVIYDISIDNVVGKIGKLDITQIEEILEKYALLFSPRTSVE